MPCRSSRSNSASPFNYHRAPSASDVCIELLTNWIAGRVSAFASQWKQVVVHFRVQFALTRSFYFIANLFKTRQICRKPIRTMTSETLVIVNECSSTMIERFVIRCLFSSLLCVHNALDCFLLRPSIQRYHHYNYSSSVSARPRRLHTYVCVCVCAADYKSLHSVQMSSSNKRTSIKV